MAIAPKIQSLLDQAEEVYSRLDRDYAQSPGEESAYEGQRLARRVYLLAVALKRAKELDLSVLDLYNSLSKLIAYDAAKFIVKRQVFDLCGAMDTDGDGEADDFFPQPRQIVIGGSFFDLDDTPSTGIGSEGYMVIVGPTGQEIVFERLENIETIVAIAGETIPPRSAVCVGKASDGLVDWRIYKADKRIVSRWEFVGFSENVVKTVGQTIRVHYGRITSFGTLAPGNLFLANDGGWTQTYPEEDINFDDDADIMVKVARAESPTDIRVNRSAMVGALVHLPDTEESSLDDVVCRLEGFAIAMGGLV